MSTPYIEASNLTHTGFAACLPLSILDIVALEASISRAARR